MENPDTPRSRAAWRQPVCDPYVHGPGIAAYFLRYVEYYFADFGPATFAAVLEEVASRLSNEAEILRGGRVWE